jgi:V/A-type H+-transporting ATPase subunit I
MLGTLPAYNEMDLAPFFMIGLPLFAAMLIGDAGYGLILAGAGLVFYKKLVKAAGKPSAQLLIIFGLATLFWGAISGNYFGVTPQVLLDAGFEKSANIMDWTAPLWRWDDQAGRDLIMQISLLFGCIHLIIAHLRRIVELWPDVRAYAEVGWIVLLADMMALIWYLMFIGVDKISPAIGIILIAGLVCVSWFSEPNASPVKRALTGFASSLLPLIGTFSDIMSYIRLFAVGLASYYIADAFNGLGAQVAESATWVAGAPIVIFGHVLNIALAAIAIFAHGVRLNMLEFSNNVGVKWAGYAYQPFTRNNRTSNGESEL